MHTANGMDMGKYGKMNGESIEIGGAVSEFDQPMIPWWQCHCWVLRKAALVLVNKVTQNGD